MNVTFYFPEVTTISPLAKINEVIDTTATKTGLKRWHVIAAIIRKYFYLTSKPDLSIWPNPDG